MPDKNRAKNVIVEIVRQSGGRLQKKTALYKAFYVAHLVYAERAPGYLTDWPIVCMPKGPGIDCGDDLLRELRLDGILETTDIPDGPFWASEYTLVNREIPTGLGSVEVEAIKTAADFIKGKTATSLSDWTHKVSRSWNTAEIGQELNIYIDTDTDDEYAAKCESVAKIARAFREASLLDSD